MRWSSSSRPVGGKKGRGLVVKPLGKSWENGGLLGILGRFHGTFPEIPRNLGILDEHFFGDKRTRLDKTEASPSKIFV